MQYFDLLCAIRVMAACALIFAAGMGATSVRAASAGNPYEVTHVTVDVTARDAVTAQKIAMAQAQAKALASLFQRLVPPSATAQLPKLSAQQIEGLVQAVGVERQQYSDVRYIASLDITFDPAAVNQVLQNAGITIGGNSAAPTPQQHGAAPGAESQQPAGQPYAAPGEAEGAGNGQGAQQGYGGEAGQPAPANPGVTPRNVVAEVQFQGLAGWQDIRSKLASVPGVQNLNVNSISPQGASITFDFAGSLGTLQQVLAQNGLAFEESQSGFVLHAQ